MTGFTSTPAIVRLMFLVGLFVFEWEAEVRHTNSDGIEAHITAVPNGSEAKLQLTIAPDARIGFHELAMISPTGLSTSIAFWVGPPDVVNETDTLHESADTGTAGEGAGRGEWSPSRVPR